MGSHYLEAILGDCEELIDKGCVFFLGIPTYLQCCYLGAIRTKALTQSAFFHWRHHSLLLAGDTTVCLSWCSCERQTSSLIFPSNSYFPHITYNFSYTNRYILSIVIRSTDFISQRNSQATSGFNQSFSLCFREEKSLNIFSSTH